MGTPVMDVHEFDELAEAAVKGWDQPWFQDETVTLYHGDAVEVLCELPAGSVDCIVTSPPYYGLRDYGTDGQYGLEDSPAEYVETMRVLFAEARRVLAVDGTLWLNIGDSYAGKQTLPDKNLMGIPWRVAFALQDDGWILRNDIIWAKPNAMPESVTDRLSTRHEHLFMFAKRARYWFDLDQIREPLAGEFLSSGVKNPRHGRADGLMPHEARGEYATHASTLGTGLGAHKGFKNALNDAGRNPGDVWTIPTQPFSAAHFAVMPQALASRAIQAGCKPGGTVLDPFSGSGTTGLAAAKHGRKYVGIDLNADYLKLSLSTRLAQAALFDSGDG